MAEKKTSPWVWFAVGCGGIVVVGVLVLAVVIGFGVREARKIGAELKDPDKREARALEILGADELPEGYSVALAISLPLVIDFVMLTDRPPTAGEEVDPGFDESGLWYQEIIGMGRRYDEARAYFAGESDDASVLRDAGVNVNVDEILDRGTFEQGDRTMMYIVLRGGLSTQGQSHEGMMTITLIDCPGDSRGRFSMWFGPDPDPTAAPGEVDLTGSVGDPARIAAIHEGFDVCD